jgi:hypothetical protein
MVRPIKENEPLSVTVKFRLTQSDLELLRKMSAGGNQLSPLLRDLVRKEAKRRGIK